MSDAPLGSASAWYRIAAGPVYGERDVQRMTRTEAPAWGAWPEKVEAQEGVRGALIQTAQVIRDGIGRWQHWHRLPAHSAAW